VVKLSFEPQELLRTNYHLETAPFHIQTLHFRGLSRLPGKLYLSFVINHKQAGN